VSWCRSVLWPKCPVTAVSTLDPVLGDRLMRSGKPSRQITKTSGQLNSAFRPRGIGECYPDYESCSSRNREMRNARSANHCSPKCLVWVGPIGVGDGGKGGTCPPKTRGKYFSGNYYVTFGHFRAKIMYYSGIFVNFFRANIIKIRVGLFCL